jgi:tektin-4
MRKKKKFPRQSTPESWAQNSHDNIVAAENERMASIQMRELINNILHDTTKDMREQADRVENAYARRIEEMAGAKAKMENQLENVILQTVSVFKISLLISNFYSKC